MDMGKALEKVLTPCHAVATKPVEAVWEGAWDDLDICDFDKYVEGVGSSRVFNQCKMQNCTINITINMAATTKEQ